MKENNIFAILLRILNVQHNKEYSENAFVKQHNNNSFYGLHILLNRYKISHNCVIAYHKEQLYCFHTPLIVIYDDSFHIVYGFDKNIIKIIDSRGNKKNIDRIQFLQGWDGKAIEILNHEMSEEPEYYENRRKKTIQYLKKICIGVSILFLIIYNLFYSNLENNRISLLIINLTAINIFGSIISYINYLKDCNINTKISDRLCSLIKGNGCSLTASVDIPFIHNIASFSVLGLSLFLVDLFQILFIRNSIGVIAIITIFALPITIWSLVFQKKILKAWCILCILMIFSIWLQAITLIFFYAEVYSSIEWNMLLPSAMLYICTIIFLQYLSGLIKRVCSYSELQKKYDTLRFNPQILNFIFNKDITKVEMSLASTLVFGNKNCERDILIITNPLCSPCANLHNLLKSTSIINAKIRLLFVSFTPELDIINKYFISSYYKYGCNLTWNLIEEWFSDGYEIGIDFFKNKGLQPNSKEVEQEFVRQSRWIKTNNIDRTPTIFINGQKLIQIYSYNDILNFI